MSQILSLMFLVMLGNYLWRKIRKSQKQLFKYERMQNTLEKTCSEFAEKP